MNSLVPQRRDGLTQPPAFEMAVPPVVVSALVLDGDPDEDVADASDRG
jgi:hypothetical protein